MTAAPIASAFGRPLAPHRPALCPEIELWLLDGEVDLEAACRDLDECHPPPYWAFCWGAGQALARFVLDRPEQVRGRHVVDFGSGCGVVAIAAAMAGAGSVTAVDCDPDARRAAERNAGHNGVPITTAAVLADAGACDVLLAADVLYEGVCVDDLLAQRERGHTVIVSDPGRASAPDLGLPAAARYAARTLPDVDSPMTEASVFVLP